MSTTTCGFKWDAPRVPTPGTISAREFQLVPGGVVANPTRVAQECILPKGHEGDHRSAHKVTFPDAPTERPYDYGQGAFLRELNQ